MLDQTGKSNFDKTSFLPLNLFWILILIISSPAFFNGCSLHPDKIDKNSAWMDAKSDIDGLFKDQEPVKGPISVYEAMARTIKYNREHKLKMMESALSLHQKNLSFFDLLPKLTAKAGYEGRDNERAASSESYKTGNESLEASISQDKSRSVSDVTFTWSILDFGLSYVRAQQKSDKYLMAREVERKTTQNIIRDVRFAWWQALTAQRLMKKIDPLMKRVQKSLKNSEEIEKKRLDSPLKALKYQKSLIEMLRTLEFLKSELSMAKPRLSSLMGLPYGQKFSLKDPGFNNSLPDLNWDMDIMEKIALISRPELMESRYKDRITEKETKAALLKILPNMNFDAGWNYDSNSYLVDNTWFGYGAHVSWNLFNIFKTPKTLKMCDITQKVSKERKLAMSITIMMQLQLAKADFLISKKRFEIEDHAFNVETRILKQITSKNISKSRGEQDLIRQELNHLVADVRRGKTYAELENNFGRLLVTMGINTLPEKVWDISVKGLAKEIEKTITAWNKKNLNEVETLNSYLPQN